LFPTLPCSTPVVICPNNATRSIWVAIAFAMASETTWSTLSASANHSIDPTTSAERVVAVRVTLSKVGSLAMTVEPPARNAEVGSVTSRPIWVTLLSIGTTCAPACMTADRLRARSTISELQRVGTTAEPLVVVMAR
jgi:hypothetical protein